MKVQEKEKKIGTHEGPKVLKEKRKKDEHMKAHIKK
jgi:hypothetical protein